jgi:hypothetical protein
MTDQQAMIRRFFVVCAAIAALVLGIVVLAAKPDNTVDLLSGGIIAAGAGLLALLL